MEFLFPYEIGDIMNIERASFYQRSHHYSYVTAKIVDK